MIAEKNSLVLKAMQTTATDVPNKHCEMNATIRNEYVNCQSNAILQRFKVRCHNRSKSLEDFTYTKTKCKSLLERQHLFDRKRNLTEPLLQRIIR